MLEYVLQSSSDTDMSAKVVASSCLGFWTPAASHFSHLPLYLPLPKLAVPLKILCIEFWSRRDLYQAGSLDSWVIGCAVVKLIIWQCYCLWQGDGHLGWSWFQSGCKGIALPKAAALSCWSLPPCLPTPPRNCRTVLIAYCHFYVCLDHDRHECYAHYANHVWVMWCTGLGIDAGNSLYVWYTNLALYSWFHWKLDCWYICGKATPAWRISAEMWSSWKHRCLTYLIPISNQSLLQVDCIFFPI